MVIYEKGVWCTGNITILLFVYTFVSFSRYLLFLKILFFCGYPQSLKEKSYNLLRFLYSNYIMLPSGFGGLGVACWPLVPKFVGSNPAEAVGFLRAKKSSARLPSEGK